MHDFNTRNSQIKTSSQRFNLEHCCCTEHVPVVCNKMNKHTVTVFWISLQRANNGLNIRKAANTLLAKAYLQSGRYQEALAASAKGLQKTDSQADRTVLAPYEQAVGSGSGTGANALYTAAVANATVTNKRYSMNKFFIAEDQKCCHSKKIIYEMKNDRNENRIT